MAIRAIFKAWAPARRAMLLFSLAFFLVGFADTAYEQWNGTHKVYWEDVSVTEVPLAMPLPLRAKMQQAHGDIVEADPPSDPSWPEFSRYDSRKILYSASCRQAEDGTIERRQAEKLFSDSFAYLTHPNSDSLKAQEGDSRQISELRSKSFDKESKAPDLDHSKCKIGDYPTVRQDASMAERLDLPSSTAQHFFEAAIACGLLTLCWFAVTKTVNWIAKG